MNAYTTIVWGRGTGVLRQLTWASPQLCLSVAFIGLWNARAMRAATPAYLAARVVSAASSSAGSSSGDTAGGSGAAGITQASIPKACMQHLSSCMHSASACLQRICIAGGTAADDMMLEALSV